MTPLQEKELALLKEFVAICDRLQLRYYLVCGSALGAVKYQGFIPWDDDVDVALPRKEYEIFLAEAPSMLPPQFFLQDYRSDPAFPAIFAKLRDSNTTFLEKSASRLNIHHGIYMDIFRWTDTSGKRDPANIGAPKEAIPPTAGFRISAGSLLEKGPVRAAQTGRSPRQDAGYSEAVHRHDL